MSGLSRSDINEILGLIDNSNFYELRIETGDLKIELRRAGGPVVAPARNSPEAAPRVVAAPAAAISHSAAAVAAGDGDAVPAPMLGTFYRAPKPGAEPFVKPGDVITAETVIGVIEVMKLMNPIEAGIAGVVTEIVAPNGELVEHGDTLIRVKAA